MSHITTSFTTTSSTGNRSLTGLGFQPAYIRLTVAQKNGTSETFIHKSEGFTDGTNQGCTSIFWDSTGGKTVSFTDRVIDHINRVSGTLTDVIVATIVSLDADGFTLNFSTTTTSYRVFVEAWS